jgi:hypothetical protein
VDADVVPELDDVEEAPLDAMPPAAPTSAHVVATAIAPIHFLRPMNRPFLDQARVIAA